MKRFYSLAAYALCALLMTSCSDSGSDEPTPEEATFRVDLQQTGDYEKFTKIVTISGGEFKSTGTNEPMPTILYNEELADGSVSYEADDVRELKVHSTIGFSPVEDAPASMAMKITVYQNGEVLDENTYTYTQDSDAVNKELTYKANQ
ncbi:beta-barrel fold lipoprotein [Pontibacter litorisediminis]|uniref:beta-barrel fold lipoprotein n=1 Tax=Pontibacter litorisediminis TaxID=1846260 RepID=UPI0023ED913E|nr:hypothetical protein [Pontibacter litorisediminis]